MSTTIVTGLGFGDEGKGTIVDYLSRQDTTLVVRHSGGSQCGHNVVTASGQHHCFSQFGAGTLAGAKTFLSRFMLINPLNMLLEANHLKELGHGDVWYHTYIDRDATIITPLHVELNRALERARGADRHGSCGQGIGTAMQQSLQCPDVTIRVRDLTRQGLLRKLELQRDWVLDQHPELSIDIHLGRLADDYRRWAALPQIVPGDALGFLMSINQNTVFEGAQGVLLDEWRGWHPYTTWSTTTHDNALTLIAETDVDEPVTRLGVTRAYATRHGAGPFVTESLVGPRFDEPHNAVGEWQGAFRQGHLDLVALRYAVKVCSGIDQVAVTHLDLAHSWMYCHQYSASRYAFGGPTIDDIPVGDFKDLEFQAKTTAMLKLAAPNYHCPPGYGLTSVMCETDALLDAIDVNVGPVGITSWGPTAGDKKVRKVANV